MEHSVSRKIKTVLFVFFVAVLFVFPAIVSAAGLTASASKASYSVGDTFTIQVKAQTGGIPINTITGKLILPKDIVSVGNVSYGNSFVSLWIDRPRYDSAQGAIVFSGGVPGGFTGSTGSLFSVSVKGKKVGIGSAVFSDTVILKNDGQGTPFESLDNNILKLSIVAAKEEKKEEPAPATTTPSVLEQPRDTVPPESFLPLVSQHPSVADNAYFVSFSAVDRESGVDRYEVKEEPYFLPFWNTDWVRSESPYVLQNQMWITDVFIRAYDREGNYRESFAVKPFATNFLGGVLLVLVLCLAIFRKKRVTLVDRKRKNK